MKRFIFIVCFCLPLSAWAVDLAQCHGLEGHTFFPYLSVLAADKAGWTDDDAIDDARYTLTGNEHGFDIIRTDAQNVSTSAREFGALVKLLRKSRHDFTFLVFYRDGPIELYTFMKENNGNLSINFIQSLGGESLMHKSSIYVGKCDFIEFSFLKNK